MTVLLDLILPRTLDDLVARLGSERPNGLVEAWVFEDAVARRAAEIRLAELGVLAKIRSAYKPLLCFFLEEIDLNHLRCVTIRYPRHELAHPERFLAEAYPLVPILTGVDVKFLPGDRELLYEVEIEGHEAAYLVYAPNRVRGDVLGSCGWLRPQGQPGAALLTEFEALFEATTETVKVQGWSGGSVPAFDRLTVAIEMPGEDQDLGWGDEVLSFREAMHEDLFFTLREGLAADNNRYTRYGQIVPDIRLARGNARVKISVSEFGTPTETLSPAVLLDDADRPLSMVQIRAEVASLALPGIGAQTREGRPVTGLYKAGSLPGVLITSGQHANETSGPVGALRAAGLLAADSAAHFALVPVENVDGYELHQRLLAQNPRHMHHAARYTALGDDVSVTATVPDYERLARSEGLARSGAKLHVNLHGYPAHEWTRPLSGYLPRGFEMWSMPKGFFLIFVHHEGWEDKARALLECVATELGKDEALVAFNRRHIDAVRAHSIDQPFSVLHGIPYFLSQADTYVTPLTMITEAPDETIYGPAFVMQQQAQMKATLACVKAYWELA